MSRNVVTLFPEGASQTEQFAVAVGPSVREQAVAMLYRRQIEAMQKDVIETALLARRLDLPIDDLMTVSAILGHLSKQMADSA